MSRLASSAPLLVALAAMGCTFGVRTFERDVPRAESDTAAFARLRADFTTFGAPFDDGEVVVRGVTREGAAADVRMTGLAGTADVDAIVRGVEIEWPSADAVRELVLRYHGPSAETVWLARAGIELPLHSELELRTGANDVDVEGLDGFVGVTADFGSIRVRGAGPVRLASSGGAIDVTGASGELWASAGPITMELAGEVIAHADSGAIRGSFGGGGQITASSGAIEVELTTALSRDLRLTSDSGPITLIVPTGASFVLHAAADSGIVDVDVGASSYRGEAFDGPIGDGGSFVVRIRTHSGSIHVLENFGA